MTLLSSGRFRALFLLLTTLVVFGAACSGPSSQMTDEDLEALRGKEGKATDDGPRGLFWSLDPASPHLELAMVDVGQGDGMVITSPSGRVIVLDTGKGKDAIVSFLQSRGITEIDMMVLTHPHSDHIGGAKGILETFTVKRVLDPQFKHESRTYEKILEEIERQQIPLLRARVGRKVKMGDGIELTMLGPPEPFVTGTRSDANSNSVILRLTFDEISILFTGDSEHESEEHVLANQADYPIESTILKVAHHGSRYATDETFLEAVKPKVALISCGTGNTYGHPAPETLERLSKVTPHVFRTDEMGTIRLLTDGKSITVIPERGATLPE